MKKLFSRAGMKKRRVCFSLVLSMFMLLLLCSCARQNAQDFDGDFYCQVGEGRGEIITDNEGLLRVNFQVSVYNISPHTLDKVCVTLRLPEEMADYLAAGVLEMPHHFEHFYTEQEAVESDGSDKARGAIISWSPMIMETSYLQEHNIKVDDILDIAKQIEVQITWDGGQETHSCQMEIGNSTDQ